MSDCLVCKRIDNIAKNENPFFVAELKTGYVVLADQQKYRGYTLFLCKEHVNELHELDEKFMQEFLLEMARVARAVYQAFAPHKLNYELLGNSCSHAHWHIIPRNMTDPLAHAPIWALPEDARIGEVTQVELELLKKQLRSHI